jgi:nitroimidazol reductase NimA-like FMN-containing flavoprotein (pyridoxamine 5'-phosphate oxidase superfamily)
MSGMKLDATGLQVLSREECFRLLGSAEIGRIVFTDRALPAVQPVNFCLDGEDIVIRTAVGTKLAMATRRTIVAFEADDFDVVTRNGWSVTVIGQARAAQTQGEIVRLSLLPLTPWAPGSHDHFIVIRAEQISGRRIL